MYYLLTKLKAIFSLNAMAVSTLAASGQNTISFKSSDCAMLSEFDSGWQTPYAIYDMSVYTALCS